MRITLIEKHIGDGIIEATFQSPMGVVCVRQRTDRDGIAMTASYVDGPLSNWVLYQSIDTREVTLTDQIDAIEAADAASRTEGNEIARRYMDRAWYYGGLRSEPPTPEDMPKQADLALCNVLFSFIYVTP